MIKIWLRKLLWHMTRNKANKSFSFSFLRKQAKLSKIYFIVKICQCFFLMMGMCKILEYHLTISNQLVQLEWLESTGSLDVYLFFNNASEIGFVDILFSYSSHLCYRKNCLTKNEETVLCYFQTWRSVSLENFNDYESAATKSIKSDDEKTRSYC